MNKDISILSNSAIDEKYIVIIKFERKLFADDLKMLFLTSHRCQYYLTMEISAPSLERDEERVDNNQNQRQNV